MIRGDFQASVWLDIERLHQSPFKNGRQFAAWLGLVPKQRSSGGRGRLFGISKRGDGSGDTPT
jgi:transposase